MDFQVYNDISQILNVAIQEDDEDTNDNKLRTKYGKHTFTRDYVQKYEGQFLYNNIHGKGKYTWTCQNDKDCIIEDSFYANKIHGYSSIYYNNGGLFEGLFKLNKRYGPGVFTSENGSQDVGLWDGLSLIRLCCNVYKNFIPKLANTEFGKVKLLRYRKLVPVCYGNKTSKPTNILKSLHAPPELIENSYLLYNEYVRHEDSLLFDKELYDGLFFGEEDCLIDVISPDDLEMEMNETPSSVSFNSNNTVPMPTSTELNYLFENLDICECDICVPEAETPRNPEELLNHRRRKLKEKFLNYIRTKCKLKTKKIPITNILAWNNEKHLTDMLRYCFRFRNMETDNVTFNVQSLLAGLRNQFRKTGKYEDICKQFLINCSENNYIEVLQFSNDYYINPDLCDSNGNTGMMFAAARDCIKTIEILVSLGGNVDSLNDENLMPLTMCLLRYIAVMNDVKNWEKAFLKNNLDVTEEELEKVKNWKPNCSLINLINCTQQVHVKHDDNFDDNTDEEDQLKYEYLTDITKELCMLKYEEPPYNQINNDEKQDYLFDTDCMILDLNPKKKSKKKAKKKANKKKANKKKASKKSSKKESKVIEVSTEDACVKMQILEEERVKQNALKLIEKTIMTLLRQGSDPDIGEVPLPTLILSIFTKNIDLISGIINNKAKINVTTVDDNMTALHVLVSLKPPKKEYVDILKFLLDNKADPNLKTNETHWQKEKDIIIAKKSEKVKEKKKKARNKKTSKIDLKQTPSKTDDTAIPCYEKYQTKTPLHIIAMRYDHSLDPDCFLNEMATLLVNYGAKINNKYLGHTPLTLAILRGNVKLMETLLINGANPNIKLECDMGVPSTVLILKRYENILPTETCENIYEVLYRYHVNPLKEVNEDGNAIEFMIKEHQVTEIGDVKSKKKKRKEKKSKKNKKKGKKGTSNMEEIKNILVKTTKRVLEKYIKSQALNYLYVFLKESVMDEYDEDADSDDDNDDDILHILAKFLKPDFCLTTLQLFIDSKKISVDDDDDGKELLFDLIDLVKETNPIKKQETPYLETDDYIMKLNFEVTPKKTKYFKKYIELDEQKSTYEVCFHCLKKKDKLLFACPLCGLILFCSQKCNIANNKIKNNLHPCRVIFYNDEKLKYEECLKNGTAYVPFSKLSKYQEVLREKLKREEMKRYLAEKQLEKGGKSKRDKYGYGREDGKKGGKGKSKEAGKYGKRSKYDRKSGSSKSGKSSKSGTRGKSDKDSSRTGKSSGEDSKSGKKKKLKSDDSGKSRKSGKTGDSEKSGKGGKVRNKGKDGEVGKAGKAKKSGKGETYEKSENKSRGRSKQLGKSKDHDNQKRGKSKDSSTYKRSASNKTSGKTISIKDEHHHKQSDSTGVVKRTTFDLSKKPSSLFKNYGLTREEVDKFERLPLHYQYFMHKFIQLFPDFDLSLLLLPYVCYKDGELYYKFNENKYFCSNYSNI